MFSLSTQMTWTQVETLQKENQRLHELLQRRQSPSPKLACFSLCVHDSGSISGVSSGSICKCALLSSEGRLLSSFTRGEAHATNGPSASCLRAGGLSGSRQVGDGRQ